MDRVPLVFMEDVCLRLDRRTLHESRKIASTWGDVSTAMSEKLHSLYVLVDDEEGKLYAAAHPHYCEDADAGYYASAVPLDSVNLKYVTNFHIKPDYEISSQPESNWKEISMEELQRLASVIRPVKRETHPLRYDYESLNTLAIHEFYYMQAKLLSLRLPVDSAMLYVTEHEIGQNVSSNVGYVEKFIQLSGFLYGIQINGIEARRLQPSMADMLIEKFIPIDEGRFDLGQELDQDQLRRLFDKCVAANKKVEIKVKLDDSTTSFDSTELVAYDANYSEREVLEEGKSVLFTSPEGQKVPLRARCCRSKWLEWRWGDAELLRRERS